jgi:hypothetical protein
MPRDKVIWEDGKKYVVVHGFKFRSGYIPARERRERAKIFNLAPLTVMGPKPKVGHKAGPDEVSFSNLKVNDK